MLPPKSDIPGWLHSVLRFLEHNFVILPAGIIGGIVAGRDAKATLKMGAQMRFDKASRDILEFVV